MTSTSALMRLRTEDGRARIDRYFAAATREDDFRVRSGGYPFDSKLTIPTLHSLAQRIIRASANPPGLCRMTRSLSAGLSLSCASRRRRRD